MSLSLRPMLLQTTLRARGSILRSSPLSTLSRPHGFVHAPCSPSPILSLLRKSNFHTSPLSREASKVSMKPASQNLEHVAVNAKEEASSVARTIAHGIAGGSDVASVTRNTEAGHAGGGHKGELKESFLSVTQAIASTVPRHILIMGLAGSLPYLGSSITTLYVARQASLAAAGLGNSDIAAACALLDTCQHFQITYGAVLLSFLGAMHWGMEFSKFGGYQGYTRLTLGVLPLLGAWQTLGMEPQMALVSQWFLFTLLWVADMRATTAGWAPPWYSQYRFYLSILVGTCILGTLFGINYLGPTTDIALAKHLRESGALGSSMAFMDHIVKGDIDQSRKNQKKGSMGGKAKDLWTEVGEDGYIKIMKKKEEEKEESEGEEGASDSESEEGGDDAKKEDDKSSSDDDSKSDDDSDDGKKSDSDDKKKSDSDDDKKSENADSKKDAKDQKNPKAGETGENMDSAVKEKSEGVVKSRKGASKKDK